MDKIKILYIAGYTRSGTTLLSRILAQLNGAVTVGETFFLWTDGWLENQLCECKKPFNNCDFWQKVLEKAFDNDASVVVPRILELQQQVNRHRHLPQLFFPVLRTDEFNESLQEYKELLKKFYQSLQEVTDSEVIIDPAKHIAHAYILSEFSELSVIHLVRDCRAVAYSWQRQKKDPAKGNYMPVLPTYRSTLEWGYINLWGEMLARKASKYMRVRYEDLTNFPVDTIKTISDFAGLSYQEGMLNDNSVVLRPSHTITGNPDRFESGKIKIRPDMEWVSRLNLSNKIIVNALTWPLLKKYGYHVFSVGR